MCTRPPKLSSLRILNPQQDPKLSGARGLFAAARGPVFICLRNSKLHLHPTPGHLTSLSGKPFKANQNCQPLFLPHRGSFHTIKHSPGHSNHDHGHLSTLDLHERAHQSCPVPRRQEKDSLEGARNKLRGYLSCTVSQPPGPTGIGQEAVPLADYSLFLGGRVNGLRGAFRLHPRLSKASFLSRNNQVQMVPRLQRRQETPPQREERTGLPAHGSCDNQATPLPERGVPCLAGGFCL